MITCHGSKHVDMYPGVWVYIKLFQPQMNPNNHVGIDQAFRQIEKDVGFMVAFDMWDCIWGPCSHVTRIYGQCCISARWNQRMHHWVAIASDRGARDASSDIGSQVTSGDGEALECGDGVSCTPTRLSSRQLRLCAEVPAAGNICAGAALASGDVGSPCLGIPCPACAAIAATAREGDSAVLKGIDIWTVNTMKFLLLIKGESQDNTLVGLFTAFKSQCWWIIYLYVAT